MIIGVRENEPAAAALTVSPARAKLIAFAVRWVHLRIGRRTARWSGRERRVPERFFRVEDSLSVVAMAVIGGLGSLTGAVTGALWVVGLPSFWPTNTEVPLFTSSIGLLIILLYIPGGFTQIGYWLGMVCCGGSSNGFGGTGEGVTAPPSLTRAPTEGARDQRRRGCPTTQRVDRSLRRNPRRQRSRFLPSLAPARSSGSSAPKAGKSALCCTPSAASCRARCLWSCSVATSSASRLTDARAGLGRHLSPEPHHALSRAHGARDRGARARSAPRDAVLGHVAVAARSSFLGRTGSASRKKKRELIDFLGLGRYADRFIAELSTGTRRIVELATVLAVAPRVICLDEPTAGVAPGARPGVRTADQQRATGARHDPRRRRARPPVDPVDQRRIYYIEAGAQ